MPKNKIRVYTKDRGVVDVKVAPNQKVVEVHKIHPSGKILDIAANKRAQQNLTPTTYVLYMHFILNLPGYKEALSLSYITESTSLSERGYYKAINELIEKRYLVREPHKDFTEYFGFYEEPKAHPQSTPEGVPSSDESLDEPSL